MRANQRRTRSIPLIEELEPRVLFSAGLDVALIDSQLQDPDLLSKACAAAEAVVVYDSTTESAADVLLRATLIANQHGQQIESLSILSHGSAGEFKLGTDTISLDNLDMTRQDWQALAGSMVEGGNIYLFGCNVGAGPGGDALVEKLAELTHSDVFASDDLTGQGGDWDLEVASRGAQGELAAGLESALDAGILRDYAGTLNQAPVVNDQSFSVAENSANGTVVGAVSASDAEPFYLYAVQSGAIQRVGVGGSPVQTVVSGFTGLKDIAIDEAGGKMYFTDTDPGGPSIMRANLDGSGIETLVTSSLVEPHGIKLDLANGKMYWTDRSGHQIERANLDGSGRELLYNGGGSSLPHTLALDPAGGKLYWTDDGLDEIRCSNLDGSNVQVLISTGLDFPAGIAVDPSGGKIYWADQNLHTIERANLDGSGVETIVGGLGQPRGLGLDLSAGKIYWADETTNRIQDANLDGSGVSDVLTGISTPHSVALDPTHELLYAITAGNGAGAFAIDPSTGQISVANASLLDLESTPEYDLTVQATDSGNPAQTGTGTITIALTDVNEFTPVAVDASFNLSENSGDGTYVGFVSALDADTSEALSYEITAGNTGGAFGIDAETGRIFVANGSLLDSVSTPQYALTVRVTDSTAPARNDTAAITIHVVANQAPVVSDQSFSVAENSANGTVVGSVPASDPDAGAGAWADSTWAHRRALTVDYTQVAGNLANFPLLVSFASNPDLAAGVGRADGLDIFFTLADGTKLDHEIELFQNTTGQLSAWVRIPSLSASTDTTIYMYYGNAAAADQQNAAGVWDASFELVHHFENLQDSTSHNHDLTALGDASLGTAGQVGAGAAFDGSGDGFTLGDIDALDGIQKLTVSAWVRMDQLVDSQSVVGKSGSSSNLGWGMAASSAASGGNNDVAVAMGQLPAVSYQGDTTNSNALSAGALHHWVAVFDGTASVAQRIRFYLDGVEVTTTTPNTVPTSTPVTSHELRFGSTPYATSPDLKGMLDEVRISTTNRSVAWIATEYRNEKNPESFVTLGVEEAHLSYAITAGDPAGAFAIDPTTGQITVADGTQLDHEAVSQYVLTVKVTDSGSPALSSFATVTIGCTDVNEFDPVAQDASFSVAENSANGTVVGDVVAADADTSQTLSCAITAGNASGAFAINAATGQITVADGTQLDHEALVQHVLTVTVTDSLAPNRSDTATVTIDVSDVNEFAPVAPDAAFSVAENAANGTVLGSVVASDADTSQTLSYAITAGNASGAFAIDAATGQITVADGSLLDRESAAQHVLTITATDSGAPARSGSSTVTIDVADVNEFDPVVQSVALAVPENAANGTLVGSVVATDADTSQTLTYSISGGDPAGIFAIDPVSGQITVADGTQLDHEATAQYVLTVKVTDSLAPVRSGSAAVTVDVTDVNEFAPVANTQQLTVNRDARLGVLVGGVQASDADTSQTLSYAISGGDPDGVFAIDAATGQISVARGGVLALRDPAKYVLTITVTDSGNPAFSSTATVTIDVVDYGPVDPPEGSTPEGPLPRIAEAARSEAPVQAPIREPAENPLPAFVYDGDAAPVDLRVGKLPRWVEPISAAEPAAPVAAARVRSKVAPEAVRIDPQLWDALERVHAEMSPEVAPTYWFADLRAFALLIGLGSVNWLLRGPSLLTSLLMSLPAWLGFDPLPIVSGFKRTLDEEEEFEEWREAAELEDVFDPESEAAKSEIP